MSETLSAIGDFVGENIGRVIPLNLSFEFSKTEIGNLLLDVLVKENPKFEGKVTHYPVENGSEMSDHIFAKSQTLSIEGICSNSEAYSFNFLTKKSRLLGIVETAQQVFLERKIVKVVTGLSVYNNMGIESISITRSNQSPKDGNWLDVSIELRHITKVSLRRADVPAAAPASGRTGTTAARTTTNANAAGTPVAAPAAAAAGNNRTLLQNGVDLLGTAGTALRGYLGGS